MSMTPRLQSSKQRYTARYATGLVTVIELRHHSLKASTIWSWSFPLAVAVSKSSARDRNSTPLRCCQEVDKTCQWGVEGQRKCPRQWFRRSVPETSWQQAGRVSADGFWRDL